MALLMGVFMLVLGVSCSWDSVSSPTPRRSFGCAKALPTYAWFFPNPTGFPETGPSASPCQVSP